MNENPKDFIIDVAYVFTQHSKTLIGLAETSNLNAVNALTESERTFWGNITETLKRDSVEAVKKSTDMLKTPTMFSVR